MVHGLSIDMEDTGGIEVTIGWPKPRQDTQLMELKMWAMREIEMWLAVFQQML
jgi:hypothetical protein